MHSSGGVRRGHRARAGMPMGTALRSRVGGRLLAGLSAAALLVGEYSLLLFRVFLFDWHGEDKFGSRGIVGVEADGAAEGIGGYRAHILHEICHAILCLLGFTPILDRAFKNNELKPFESMEWQAKALCGEILMPYEETEGLSVRQIRHLCQVSRESAELRYNNYRKPGPKSPLERRGRQWL